MSIHIQETWENATEGYVCGESEVYETRFDSLKQLFVCLRKKYGRCNGKMYVEKKQGGTMKSVAIGWVFEKSAKYEDVDEKYLQRTWVSVHEKPSRVRVERYYTNIETGKAA